MTVYADFHLLSKPWSGTVFSHKKICKHNLVDYIIIFFIRCEKKKSIWREIDMHKF